MVSIRPLPQKSQMTTLWTKTYDPPVISLLLLNQLPLAPWYLQSLDIFAPVWLANLLQSSSMHSPHPSPPRLSPGPFHSTACSRYTSISSSLTSSTLFIQQLFLEFTTLLSLSPTKVPLVSHQRECGHQSEISISYSFPYKYICSCAFVAAAKKCLSSSSGQVLHWVLNHAIFCDLQRCCFNHPLFPGLRTFLYLDFNTHTHPTHQYYSMAHN